MTNYLTEQIDNIFDGDLGLRRDRRVGVDGCRRGRLQHCNRRP